MDEADQWLTRALGNAIFAGAGDRMPKEMNTMWPKDVEGTQKIVPDGTPTLLAFPSILIEIGPLDEN